MQIASNQYNHKPVTWITADAETLVPHLGRDGESEDKSPAKDCPVIHHKGLQYLRDDVFLECYIQTLRYKCSTISRYILSFGGNGDKSNNVREITTEAKLRYQSRDFHDGHDDENMTKWIKRNAIDFVSIEKAVQRVLPNYAGTNSSNSKYTYLSGEFITIVFRPLVPNTPLVKYSQRLSSSRFGAMVGLCLKIPELFIRTILNLTLSIAIAINKKRDPIGAELQGVRYTINQAAAIAVFNKCLLEILGI